jgi:RNA polymerase sigma factor (sigma-70 family)
MSAAAIRGVVRRLGSSPAEPLPDAELVAAFAAHRDADAFAALVDRHGPAVLGVCRRVLGNAHDAEDAFQAVFLVLARRVRAVRPPGTVGGWLYGVAVRTASKARVALARRRRREMIAASSPAGRESGSPALPPELTELRIALDEELGRLPDSLRAVVVLCDLHEKTRAEAAGELGCPEGTIAARLHRGRRKLGAALARRGLALPSAGLATILVPATVSAGMARSAVAAALGSAAPAVLALAREVTRGLTSTTHAIALTAVTLLAGGLLASGNIWPTDAPAPPPAPSSNAAIAADAPGTKSAASEWRESKVLDQAGWLVGSVAYSHDGKALYISGTSGNVRAYSTDSLKLLWEYKGEERFSTLAVSPDDRTLAVTTKDGVQFLDAQNGKAQEKLDEPASEPLAVAFFPDKQVFDPQGGLLGTSRKVIFASARGSIVKSWLKWPGVGTINLGTTVEGKEPPDTHATPLAVDPSGKRVVVTGPIERTTGKNVLWAWSAGSGEGNKILEGHKAVVISAAWSADGKVIVTGDADGVVILWDAATFKEKSRLTLGGRVAAVTITADGRYTAAAVTGIPEVVKKDAYHEDVFAWEAASPPKELKPISRHTVGGPFAGVASLAFAHNGKSLAVAFANFTHLTRLGELAGKVRILTLANDQPTKGPVPIAMGANQWTEKAVLSQHAGPVDSVAFDRDGKRFVTGGADGNVFLWNGTTLEPRELGALVPAGKFTAVAFSPNGKLVAASRDRVTGFFDPEKLQPVLMNPPFPGGRGVAFSPDGKWVATSDGFTTGFRALTPGGGEAYGSRPGALEGQIPSPVAWSADSLYLASIMPTEDGNWMVGIMGVTSETKPRNLDGHKCKVHAVAWSKDGKLLASGGEDGTVILWNGETFAEVRRGNIVGRDGGPTRYHSLAFSSDGKTLAAAVTLGSGKSADRIVLFDTETMEADGNLFPPGSYPARTVAFSPDGKLLVAACGIDREKVTAVMSPDEMKAAGAVVIWERPAAKRGGEKSPPLENVSLRKFQGSWQLDGFDLGGGNKLTDEEIKALGWTLAIEGNRFQSADKNGKETSSGRIAVDPSQEPPVLVRIVTDRERDLYTWCLYELEGDTLRLCQDVHQKGMPKEFKAGKDTTIVTYKRIKK